MKKTVTEDRYEEQGSPMCWIWGFIGAMWLVQAILRTGDDSSLALQVCSWVCVVCSFVTAVLWSRYRLVVDEKGVRQSQAGMTTELAWEELERVTVHNRVSFWKATGLTFCPSDPRKKKLYINRVELLPLVKRYADCPVEEAA